MLVTFVAVPVGAVYPSGHAPRDAGHLVFALGPAALNNLGLRLGLGVETSHETIAVVAFAFNLLVTAPAALHLTHAEVKKRQSSG